MKNITLVHKRLAKFIHRYLPAFVVEKFEVKKNGYFIMCTFAEGRGLPLEDGKDRVRLDEAYVDQDEAGQDEAGQDEAGQDEAGQAEVDPDEVDPDETGQDEVDQVHCALLLRDIKATRRCFQCLSDAATARLGKNLKKVSSF
jgi:hypothetical protein